MQRGLGLRVPRAAFERGPPRGQMEAAAAVAEAGTLAHAFCSARLRAHHSGHPPLYLIPRAPFHS